MTGVLAGGLAALAVVLAMAPRPLVPERSVSPRGPRPERLRRWRWLWAVSAGVACWTWRPGWPGLVLGVVAAAGVWHLVATAEPAAARRAREEVRADLPVLVLLLATTLRAGASPGAGVRRVCAALPGPAADRLAVVSDRLGLGLDPVAVWEEVGRDPDLAPLGRAMARAHRSGAPVAETVQRVAEELAAAVHAEVEDRARAVGVKAAVPLGVCLLPSFLLLGIVPMVAGLVSGLQV